MHSPFGQIFQSTLYPQMTSFTYSALVFRSEANKCWSARQVEPQKAKRYLTAAMIGAENGRIRNLRPEEDLALLSSYWRMTRW